MGFWEIPRKPFVLDKRGWRGQASEVSLARYRTLGELIPVPLHTISQILQGEIKSGGNVYMRYEKVGTNGCGCAVCGKRLFPDDLIVNCPDCGAIICQECADDGALESHECEEEW